MIQAHHIRVQYAPRVPFNFIDTPTPMLQWAVSGSPQAAWALTVACGPGDSRVLLDTGWVQSPEPCIAWPGEPLPPGKCVGCTLRVRGQDGSVYEDAIALIYAAFPQWDAAWLADPAPREDRPVDFIGKIHIAKPVRFAALYCGATGYAQTLLNDEETAPLARLNPALSEYEKRCYYSAAHIDDLKIGKNILRATLAPGWRSVHNPCYQLTGGQPAALAGEPAFTAMLYVEYTDGAEAWFRTDSTWQAQHSPIVYSNLFMGETYDANFVPERPVSARVVPSPTKKMSLQAIPPVEPQERYSPVAVWRLGEGHYVADFGQNLAGVCRLDLPEILEKGQRITMKHMEELDEDGSVYMAPARNAACLDTYIASGDAGDLAGWVPQFVYHGFRYVEIEGYPAFTADQIEAYALYTSVAKESDFRCGSALVNAIHRMAVQTEKANIHSILTDCPQRDERMGWMNDATVRFEETPYNFEIGALFPKVVRDLMDVQDEQGRITCTAPFVFGGRPADPVCSSFLAAGWQSWLHTGNDAILREAFDAWARWDDYLESRSENGIVGYSYYGDWAGPAYACLAPENAKSAVTPGVLMSTGYHYYNNVLLSRMAALIGRDPAPFQARAEKIRAAFLREWWHGDTGVVATGSQACQAFALWLDILPEAGREKAARVMRDDLAARNYRFTTGNLCTRYLMDELARYGYIDDAWRLLTKEDYPSFGYMLQNEATTVWERFELKKDPGMNSHNHPMYGALDYWLYACLAGVRPVDGGWKRAEIRPCYPSALLSCQATASTPFGPLSVRWVKRYGALHLYAQIPQGVQARVFSPEGEKLAGPGFHHWQSPLEAE